MLIAGTKENRRLAGVVNARVAADAAMLSAKAWLIRCTALGVLALMIGAGVGLAYLGVAKSRDSSGAADRLAATLTRALEQSKLHAEIDPGSTVKLEPGGKVAMDPDANTVALSDAAGVPHPTRDQLKPDATPASNAAVQTKYTVFKTVPFGTSKVVTGYNFSPEGKLPDNQYCYVADGIDPQSYRAIHIAEDGRFTAPPNPPSGLDPVKAAANCVWYDGKPTRF